METINLVGQRFGRLLVQSKAAATPGRDSRWTCRCDCGQSSVVRGTYLRTGKTRSCGCLVRVRARENAKRHGQSRTPTHLSWMGAIQRCTDPNHARYADYGGRGIKVCERWQVFENFLADMGERPAGTSIDRINNDGDYEPDNCRWATKTQQARNCRTNHTLTIDGQTRSVAEWVELRGLNYRTVMSRLARGWPAEPALTPGSTRLARLHAACAAMFKETHP